MVNIQRVVILGANGTMGAGSAEVFAAGGCDVVLLARSTEKAREGLVGAQNMAKSIRIGDRMRVGTYDGDFDETIGKADLIFEAVAEDLEIKKTFFERVDKHPPAGLDRRDRVVGSVDRRHGEAGLQRELPPPLPRHPLLQSAQRHRRLRADPARRHRSEAGRRRSSSCSSAASAAR